MRDRNSLGSDDLNKAKVVSITVFLILISFLVFLTANASQEVAAQSNFYTILAVIAVMAMVVDFVFKKSGFKVRKGGQEVDLPDTLNYERKSALIGELPHTLKFALVVAVFIFGGYLINSITTATASQIVAAPTFQVIDIGIEGNAFLSGIAGVIENWFFFGFIMSTLFSVILIVTRSFWASVGGILLIMPFIFTGYHFAVYGESTVALQTVYLMGVVWSASSLILGTLLVADVTHFANNFGVRLAQSGAASSGIFLLMYGVIAALISIFAWRSKPSKDGYKRSH